MNDTYVFKGIDVRNLPLRSGEKRWIEGVGYVMATTCSCETPEGYPHWIYFVVIPDEYTDDFEDSEQTPGELLRVFSMALELKTLDEEICDAAYALLTGQHVGQYVAEQRYERLVEKVNEAAINAYEASKMAAGLEARAQEAAIHMFEMLLDGKGQEVVDQIRDQILADADDGMLQITLEMSDAQLLVKGLFGVSELKQAVLMAFLGELAVIANPQDYADYIAQQEAEDADSGEESGQPGDAGSESVEDWLSELAVSDSDGDC